MPVILFKRTKLKAGAKLDARENEGTMKDCCARLADAVPSIEAFLEAYGSEHDYILVLMTSGPSFELD